MFVDLFFCFCRRIFSCYVRFLLITTYAGITFIIIIMVIITNVGIYFYLKIDGCT